MTLWPLPRRRGPGWYGPRSLDITIFVDVVTPPALLMWVYVEREDGTREWLKGRSETECDFTGRCRVLRVEVSAECPR